MTQFAFAYNGVPVAKGRPRMSMRGKYPIVYTPTKTRNAEDGIRLFAKRTFKEPLKGPLRLRVLFYMPIPKSLAKKVAPESPHVKRPDLDNLIKTVSDALNGIAYEDDSQVAELVAMKVYRAEPGTVVIVEEIENAAP